MLLLKPGVDVTGISTEILIGLQVLAGVFWKHGIPTLITSCRDGEHMEGSKHYLGDAVDVRLPSRFSSTEHIDIVLLNEGRVALGDQYDLVLEEDHLHLEFDPKKDAHT